MHKLLQDDYLGIKDDARYRSFTALYNKMNKNHSILIEEKIINLVSIFKIQINHMNHSNGGNNCGQVGRSRVKFSGRGHGVRSGGRGRGRRTQVGQSRGGCSRSG